MSFKPIIFGRYALMNRIAVGGMAEVFRAMAFGAEGFEKLVAIKRMLPHMSRDPQFVDMFINEAKLAALLNHSHIVQIYDFGSLNNLLYLCMEYVHGKDLAAIIQRLRDEGFEAPTELVCYLLVEVLRGLEYAHRPRQRGGKDIRLIHRDVSPPNILISYAGEVKIADFGIAKVARETSNTGTGILKGKYCYMSPEQAAGEKLDHRTDLFSMAICFYELLTQEDMFPGRSELEVLEKVRAARFIKPRDINPSIPRKLEAILLRALKLDRRKRFANAAEFRDAVEKFLAEKNYRFSASWLADFMRDVFGDDIAEEQKVLDAEGAVVEEIRPDPERLAELEAEGAAEIDTLTSPRPELWDIDAGPRVEEDDRVDSDVSTIMIDRDALGLQGSEGSTDDEATAEAETIRQESPFGEPPVSEPPTAPERRPPLEGLMDVAVPTREAEVPPPPVDQAESLFADDDMEPDREPAPKAPAAIAPAPMTPAPAHAPSPAQERARARAQAKAPEPAPDLMSMQPAGGADLDDLLDDDLTGETKRGFPFGWVFLILLLVAGTVIVFALDLFGEQEKAADQVDAGVVAMQPLVEEPEPSGDAGQAVAVASTEPVPAVAALDAGSEDGTAEVDAQPSSVASAPTEVEPEVDAGVSAGADAEQVVASLPVDELEPLEVEDPQPEVDKEPPPAEPPSVEPVPNGTAKTAVKNTQPKKRRRRRKSRRKRRRKSSKRKRRKRKRRVASRKRKRRRNTAKNILGPPYLYVDGIRVKTTRGLSKRLKPGVHTLEMRDRHGNVTKRWQVRVSED